MVFGRAREQTLEFPTKPYAARAESKAEYKFWLRKEKMVKVTELKYLRMVFCKHGGVEGRVREQAMKGR